MSAGDMLNTDQFFAKKGKNPSWAYNAVNGYHAPVERIPISRIKATQDSVHVATVERYVSDPPKIPGGHDELPKLVQGSHGTTVWDGHHRIVAAQQRGETHVEAYVHRNPYR